MAAAAAGEKEWTAAVPAAVAVVAGKLKGRAGTLHGVADLAWLLPLAPKLPTVRLSSGPKRVWASQGGATQYQV
eukprot:COSAG01_NODE_4062_length_5387_cov_6.700076_2_plen_74_part_00